MLEPGGEGAGAGPERPPAGYLAPPLMQDRLDQSGHGGAGLGAPEEPPPPPLPRSADPVVEAFLDASLVDDSAADALRDCPPAVQQAVMERGGLENARNPSSVLLSRIRDATGGERGGPGGQSSVGTGPGPLARGENMEEAVEGFIATHAVDASAAEALRKCRPEVQDIVMTKGIVGARNPSSALLARIRDAENSLRSGGGAGCNGSGGGYMGGGGYIGGGGHDNQPPVLARHDEDLIAVVEDFIVSSGIDERAADALRNAGPRIQEAVLERGELVGIRNPSSAVLARIRDAQMGGCGGCGASAHPPAWNGWGGGREAVGGPCGSGPSAGPPSTCSVPFGLLEDIEAFIRAYAREGRDDWAYEILGRLRTAKSSAGRPPLQWGAPPVQSRGSPAYHGGGCGGRGLVDPVEVFLRNSGVDERAADALRRCEPRVQEEVLDRGIEGARNPSSALLARIRDAADRYNRGSRGGDDRRGGCGRSGIEEEVELWLRANSIDSKAADSMRRCDPRVQREVMDKGVSTARNPSSALLARIRDAEGRGAPRQDMRAGSPGRGGGRYAPY